MTKIKIKNPTEERLENLKKVFAVDGQHVDYEVTETQILLPNKVTADYTKTVTDKKGYEVLKDIKISVKVAGKELELNWTEDHGAVWIVHAIVNKLISSGRKSGAVNSMNAQQKEILIAERKSYNEARKNK